MRQLSVRVRAVRRVRFLSQSDHPSRNGNPGQPDLNRWFWVCQALLHLFLGYEGAWGA